MQHHPKQLLAYIRDQKEDFVELVKELVAIETPTERPDQQEGLLAILEDHFSDLNYFTYRLSGSKSGGQLYARPRNRTHGASPQILIGHCDTVWPTDTIKKMPFHEHKGILTGPGVFDMKTGIAMIIMALKTLQVFEISPSLTPVIYIYSDENTGFPEARPTIERLARYAERTFILKPAREKSGQIFTSCKGLGNFNIRIRNHSSENNFMSKPDNGSMLELSQAVQRFVNLNDPSRDIHVEVSKIDDGIRSNVIAGDHQANIQVRLRNPEDVSEIEQMVHEIESTTSGVDISINGGIHRPPALQNERNFALWQKAHNLASSMGIQISRGTREEATVATLTSPYSATLDGLGPVGMGPHTNRESINLEKTLERCALLSLLISSP